MCLCGAILSLLIFSRRHDRQLGPAAASTAVPGAGSLRE
jgi:hypothetical protein